MRGGVTANSVITVDMKSAGNLTLVSFRYKQKIIDYKRGTSEIQDAELFDRLPRKFSAPKVC